MTNSNGNGRLVTRINGVLEVLHDGSIVFRVRGYAAQKRGTEVILHIVGLPTIPRIENGQSVHIDLTPYKEYLIGARVIQFPKKGHDEIRNPARSERREGAA